MLIGKRALNYLIEGKGRVKCLYIAAWLYFISGIISGLTWNLKVLFFTFFLYGTSIMLFLDTQELYIKEISGERFQHFFRFNSALMWPIGQICAAALNLLLFSWRFTFLVCISIPALIIGYFIKSRLYEI